MNKIFQTAISTFIFFVSCSSINSNMKNNLDSGKSIPVSKDRLYTDIKEITSILPSRNSNNIKSIDQTAEYIYSQFKLQSDNVEIQSYKIKEKEYKNIICSFGHLDAERIVVGAHYDVCGDQPGADDNASGVAGLLEIAKLIKELKPK
ncbi:M28 family peptidase, partial [Candidatus Desantisbacteria bacterium]|nr:M28 family peptidase [Candidatus Desantisbacteria bacterium]